MDCIAPPGSSSGARRTDDGPGGCFAEQSWAAVANIVHPDLTLPAALDPEIIKLDKWVPLLCATHH